MLSSFTPQTAPVPLPDTLPVGARTVEVTTIEDGKPVSFRWELATEATLRLDTEYAGDWRCEGRKGTSFVRYTLVDWDSQRSPPPPEAGA
jgi:hypothetical protein